MGQLFAVLTHVTHSHMLTHLTTDPLSAQSGLYDEDYTSPEDCPSNSVHRRGLSCLSQCMLRRRYRCCYGGLLSSKTSAAFCQEFRTLLKYIQTPHGPFKNYVTLTDVWVSVTLCDNGWGVPRALRRFKFFNPLIVCFPLQELDTKTTH